MTMNAPAELKYSEEHTWLRLDGNRAYVGITDFAQAELGDIVFVELPAVGATIEYGEPFGSLESVKTVSELYAPISGTVVEINPTLSDSPELINSAPFADGWMVIVEISNEAELNKLWSAEKYAETYSE